LPKKFWGAEGQRGISKLVSKEGAGRSGKRKRALRDGRNFKV